MNADKYLCRVRPDIIREIEKRGLKENRRDPVTGLIEKNKKSAVGPSSAFGWGAVDDTIPVSKKNLENVRRNFVSIMNEVILKQIVAEAVAPPPAQKRSKISPAIQRWHTYCVERYEGGSVGLIPTCFEANGPPALEGFLDTNIGVAMAHFCEFIKREF
jgi:hypothetical protein